MSDTDKTIVVLGATGQQGGAVSAALRAQGRTVRAVVRNPVGDRAQALAAMGVDIVRGDLRDPQSLRAAFSGAHGVFSVQPSSGQAGADLTDEDEIRFATSVAEAAEQSGVAHFVYTSTVAAGATLTGVPHFDTKIRIEAHLRGLGLPATVVRPASFMDTLVLPGMGLDQGQLSFLMRPGQSMQFIAVHDIGRIVAAIFADPDRYLGLTLEIAGDQLTGNDLAGHLTRAVGKPISYSRFPATLLAQSRALADSVMLVDSGRLAGQADQETLRAQFPFLLTFEQWLAGPGAALLRQGLHFTGVGVGLR
uniref:NmrA/HSCARG family protein n=1 Tax=Paractinoplanes polyasparticus TaxID=2856853 RepID=UPI001C859718|nr:NmrA/HSCARG family protein [Actinoplanes polyasparticus]